MERGDTGNFAVLEERNNDIWMNGVQRVDGQ